MGDDDPAVPKVVFPYRSMSEAVRDRYEKLGGVEQAFRLLKLGASTDRIRKGWMRRRRVREKAEDVAFMAEHKGRRFTAAPERKRALQ